MKTIDMSLFKFCHTFFLMAFFFVLPACDLYEESWTTKERASVSQERVYETFTSDEFSDAIIANLAHDYDRHGFSPMSISVTYDPLSRNYTALNASNEVARIAKKMRENGVRDAEIGVLPAESYAGQIIVSYDAYTAKAPENCGSLPGLKTRSDIGQSIEEKEQYALGCTIETLMARQVSRPKDLMGQKQTETAVDGRRVINTAEFYRDGIPNDPLEGGESASDE